MITHQTSDISILKKGERSGDKKYFDSNKDSPHKATEDDGTNTIIQWRKIYKTEQENESLKQKNSLTDFYLTSVNQDFLANTNNSKSKRRDSARMIRVNEENQALNTTRNQFISYVLNENTKFADVEQIELELIRQLAELKEKEGIMVKEKLSKLDNLTKINKLIEEEIILHKKNSTTAIIERFNQSVNDLKRKITISNYDYNSSLKIFTRAREENEITRRELNKTFKDARLVNEQYKKFSILKNSVFSTLNKEERIYLDMKEFEGMSSINYMTQFEKKRELFNELDFKLFLARNLTIQGEKIISEIKKKQVDLKSCIKQATTLNSIKHNDNEAIRKDIILEIINTEKLNNMLGVEDINQIVKAYKDADQALLNNRTRFNFVNDEISKLNKEYTLLKQVYKKKLRNLTSTASNRHSLVDGFFESTVLPEEAVSDTETLDDIKKNEKLMKQPKQKSSNKSCVSSKLNLKNDKLEKLKEKQIELEILDHDDALRQKKIKIDDLKEKNSILKDNQMRLELHLRKVMSYVVDGIRKLMEVKIAMSDNNNTNVKIGYNKQSVLHHINKQGKSTNNLKTAVGHFGSFGNNNTSNLSNFKTYNSSMAVSPGRKTNYSFFKQSSVPGSYDIEKQKSYKLHDCKY